MRELGGRRRCLLGRAAGSDGAAGAEGAGEGGSDGAEGAGAKVPEQAPQPPAPGRHRGGRRGAGAEGRAPPERARRSGRRRSGRRDGHGRRDLRNGLRRQRRQLSGRRAGDEQQHNDARQNGDGAHCDAAATCQLGCSRLFMGPRSTYPRQTRVGDQVAEDHPVFSQIAGFRGTSYASPYARPPALETRNRPSASSWGAAGRPTASHPDGCATPPARRPHRARRRSPRCSLNQSASRPQPASRGTASTRACRAFGIAQKNHRRPITQLGDRARHHLGLVRARHPLHPHAHRPALRREADETANALEQMETHGEAGVTAAASAR